MKLRSFHVFYLLASGLFLAGIFTNKVEVISAGWHTSVEKGKWVFFMPALLVTLVPGVIYHLRWRKGWKASGRWIMFHFILLASGLLLSWVAYEYFIKMVSYETPIDTNFGALLLLFIGPVLVIASIPVFIISVVRDRKSTPEAI